MDYIISWEDCRRKHIKNTLPDFPKAASMYFVIKIRKEELEKQKTSFLKLETYYEIIKELLSAIMATKGLKSSNHECIVSYFRHRYPSLNIESKKFHELKEIRNDLQYEGKIPRDTYLFENQQIFDKIIENLEKELLKELGIP
ncbi:MAG: hypothetical protein ACP5N2_01545 [Candidatus Nanoarchaeia archaeon]